MIDEDPRWAAIEEMLHRYVGAGTFIYLLYASPHRVKIGQAMDVSERVATLRRDLKLPIVVMGACEASPELEFALHRIFVDTRMDLGGVWGTEWFRFEPILGRLARAMNGLQETAL